jgi:hypothetical protein
MSYLSAHSTGRLVKNEMGRVYGLELLDAGQWRAALKDRHKKAPVCRGCLDRVELLRQRRLKYTMPLFSSRSLLEQFLFAWFAS